MSEVSERNVKRFLFFAIAFICVAMATGMIAACSTMANENDLWKTIPQPTIPPLAIPKPATYVQLYWENTTEPHPERKPWSIELLKVINQDMALYEKASDITRICSNFHQLTATEKARALAEFWIGIAYYESGFQPDSSDVDTGTAADPKTWSVGLFQLSVVDQASFGFSSKFTFNDLLMAIPNIDLMEMIMARQLKLTNTIILPVTSKHRYWATILDGGKYQKIDEILARVKKHSSCK